MAKRNEPVFSAQRNAGMADVIGSCRVKHRTQFTYRIKEDISNEKMAKENMGQRHCMDGYHFSGDGIFH